MLEQIFWPITKCSSLYATGVTRIQSVVLYRIGGRGHFQSLDKDDGHTIRSAMAKNPLLYAILYRTGVIADWKFYIAGIANFTFFC